MPRRAGAAALAAAAAALLLAPGANAQEPRACVFTVNGATYDLSALRGRPYDAPSLVGGFNYKLQLCEALGDGIPDACKRQHPAAVQSPVLQMAFAPGTRVPTECYYLGHVDAVEAHPMHAEDPSLGVELVYKHGQRCSDGRERETRFHMICAHNHGVEHPPYFVVETPERCHYNVTWPSVHACPLPPTMAARLVSAVAWLAYWSTVLWYGGLLIYLAVGCGMSAWRGQGEFGTWAAMPHRLQWEQRWARAAAMVPTPIASAWAALIALPGISHAIAISAALLRVCAKLVQWGIMATRARLGPWLQRRKGGDGGSGDTSGGGGMRSEAPRGSGWAANPFNAPAPAPSPAAAPVPAPRAAAGDRLPSSREAVAVPIAADASAAPVPSAAGGGSEDADNPFHPASLGQPVSAAGDSSGADSSGGRSFTAYHRGAAAAAAAAAATTGSSGGRGARWVGSRDDSAAAVTRAIDAVLSHDVQ